MKIAIIPGSNRVESINARLSRAVAKLYEARGADVSILSLSDFEMPLYDGDWEAAHGKPASAQNLHNEIIAHDAVLLVSPEHNGCMPALVKNTLDWLSGIDGMGAFTTPVWSVASCTPGAMSGIQVMRQMQFILNRLGAELVPVQLGVGNAHAAFAQDGALSHDASLAMANKQIEMIYDRVTRKAALRP